MLIVCSKQSARAYLDSTATRLLDSSTRNRVFQPDPHIDSAANHLLEVLVFRENENSEEFS